MQSTSDHADCCSSRSLPASDDSESYGKCSVSSWPAESNWTDITADSQPDEYPSCSRHRQLTRLHPGPLGRLQGKEKEAAAAAVAKSRPCECNPRPRPREATDLGSGTGCLHRQENETAATTDRGSCRCHHKQQPVEKRAEEEYEREPEEEKEPLNFDDLAEKAESMFREAVAANSYWTWCEEEQNWYHGPKPEQAEIWYPKEWLASGSS